MPFQHFADGLGDSVGVDGFEKDARHVALQQVFDEPDLLVHGIDDDTRLRVCPADMGNEVQARHVGQFNVQQKEVKLFGSNPLQDLLPGGSRTNVLDFGQRTFHDSLKPLKHQIMIVYQ